MAKQESLESGTLEDPIFVEKNKKRIKVRFPGSSPDISSHVLHALMEKFSSMYGSTIVLEITPPEESDIDRVWDEVSTVIVEALQSLGIDPAVRDE